MKVAYRDLRAYMRATGATQKEVARAVGTSQAAISRILARRQQPRLPLALRLAELANIPLDSLVADTTGEAA